MDKKQLIKALDIAVPKKNTLPILDCVLFTGNHIQATDLDTTVRLPLLTGMNIGLPWNEYKKLLSRKEVYTPTQDGVGITFRSDGETVKLTGEDADNFPCLPQGVDKQVGKITPAELQKMQTACKFADTDELRPAMCHILWSLSVVGTDGHRLFFEKSENTPTIPLLVKPHVVRLLTVLGDDLTWNVYSAEKKGVDFLKFEAEGMEIYQRVEDSRFPNWEACIPSEYAGTFTTDRKALVETVNRALEYSSSCTHQVRLSVNSKLVISAEDVDFGREYSKAIPTQHTGENITIGFNGEYLVDVCRAFPVEEVTIQYNRATQGVLVNGSLLLMPVRLGE